VPRRLAWVNSLCLLFLLVGFAGAQSRLPPLKPAPPLEQPVPDNWIPLVPVQTPEGALMFRRGTMEIPTASGLIKLQPHTSILDPGVPHFVTDRMITPAGVTVQQYLRRTRTPDGSTLVWTARRSGPGQGSGWSGLRFDFLQAVPVAGS